jgi:hypothetical protein
MVLAGCMTVVSGCDRSVGGEGAAGVHYSNFPAEVLES